MKVNALLTAYLSTVWLLAISSSVSAQISSLILIDARVDIPLYELQDIDTIDLATVGTRLNLVATVDTAVYSVSFGLNEIERVRNELTAPYAMLGDFDGDYRDWTPELGLNTVTVTPFLERNLPGTPRVYELFVIDSRNAPPPPDGDGSVTITGALRKWHKITVDVDGPFARENDSLANPFLDYRMEVTFENEERSYTVPGYFAADGNAAETGANSGTRWRAHFRPDTVGSWTYRVAFRKGRSIAVEADSVGEPVPTLDGKMDSFFVLPSNKQLPDLRAQGRLEYVGKRYLQFAETKKYFLKGGPDAPENFLAYEDFDNTSNYKSYRKNYAPHLADWKEGNPSWRNGQGKGLIGAINYLASEGMNAFSFLTFNYGGDDRNVYPHTFPEEDFLHFDCSKLDQWEIIFEHASSKGMYLHFKMQEKENDQTFDNGDLGPERKVYLREMVARYGHHLALNWNIGEENDQTDAQRIAIGDYLRQIDAFDHHIVVHAVPKDNDKVYTPLLGDQSELTGMSLQAIYDDVHDLTLTWLARSEAAGKIWVVANDEQGPSNIGVPVDPDYPGAIASTPSIFDIRHQVLWGNLMAGGAGVEYYFGYDLPDSDLTLENYRSRDLSWDYVRHALQFFRDYLPFDSMQPADSLITRGYCLADSGRYYAAYLPNGGTYTLTLPDSADYDLQWYNPRSGGVLQRGTISSLQGPGPISIGSPPASPSQDWVILVRQSAILTDNIPPIAKISANTKEGTPPLLLQFSGQESFDPDGRIQTYEWHFGDGARSNAIKPAHAFDSIGTYTVQLVVTDLLGAVDTAQLEVRVLPLNTPPTAIIEANPLSGKFPLEVLLDGRSSVDSEGKLTAFRWSFGDGNRATGTHLSYTYSAPGTYDVQLVVRDQQGVLDTTIQTIEVIASNLPPEAQITTSVARGHAPLDVAFDGRASTDSEGKLTAYRWSFGDGNKATGTHLSYTYTEPGSYEVQLVVRDLQGLLDTATQLIEVLPPNQAPVAQFLSIPVDTISQNLVRFNASGSYDPEEYPLTFRWDFGDENTGNGPEVEHLYLAPGTYPVQLLVTDSLGAKDTMTQLLVITGTIPELAATITVEDTIGIAPKTVLLDGSQSTGAIKTYEWLLDGALIADTVSTDFTFTIPGLYTTNLVVVDRFNRSDTATVTFDIYAPSMGLGEPTAEATGTILAFPNPTTGQIAIQLPEAQASGILRLWDLNGRIVRQTLVTQAQIEWDLQALPDGVYVIEHLNQDQSHFLKLILQP